MAKIAPSTVTARLTLTATATVIAALVGQWLWGLVNIFRVVVLGRVGWSPIDDSAAPLLWAGVFALGLDAGLSRASRAGVWLAQCLFVWTNFDNWLGWGHVGYPSIRWALEGYTCIVPMPSPLTPLLAISAAASVILSARSRLLVRSSGSS